MCTPGGRLGSSCDDGDGHGDGDEEEEGEEGEGGSSPRNVSHDLTRDRDAVKTDQVSGDSALIHQ